MIFSISGTMNGKEGDCSMSRLSTVILCVLVIGSTAGCFIRPRNLPAAPGPQTTLTPDGLLLTAPWVQTATFTPDANSGETTPNPPIIAVTNTPAQTSAATLAPTALASQVTAVLVKDDVRLRRGPGTSYDILGLVHAGMTLVVTGKSSDDAWWQVICEQTPNKICWVSADPELTEPAQTPP
jgi:hypothetical protein